jgi:hypothetical protein
VVSQFESVAHFHSRSSLSCLSRAVLRRSCAGHSLRADRKPWTRRRCANRSRRAWNRHGRLCPDGLASHASSTRAADRGVAIRIYLDGAQFAEREPAKVFNDLAKTPGVEIKIKRENSDPMHLKSYQIDGKLLRTGAANFSASGLKRQDNDLIVIESAQAVASFKRNFDARYASGDVLAASARQ